MGADHGNPGALPVSWKGIRMRQLRAFFFRLAGLFRKDRRDRDLSAEMETHLTMHLEDNLRAGMSLAEARRQALIKLGGIEQTKEICRERRGLPLLENSSRTCASPSACCEKILASPRSLPSRWPSA